MAGRNAVVSFLKETYGKQTVLECIKAGGFKAFFDGSLALVFDVFFRFGRRCGRKRARVDFMAPFSTRNTPAVALLRPSHASIWRVLRPEQGRKAKRGIKGGESASKTNEMKKRRKNSIDVHRSRPQQPSSPLSLFPKTLSPSNQNSQTKFSKASRKMVK